MVKNFFGEILLFVFHFTEPKLFEVDIVDTPDLERRIKALEFESEHPDIAADAATNGEWQYAIVPYTFHTDFSKYSFKAF